VARASNEPWMGVTPVMIIPLLWSIALCIER
jgi:hypothetical protein